MNNPAIFVSLILSVVLVYFGMNAGSQGQDIREGISLIEEKNNQMQQSLKEKAGIKRLAPVSLSMEYNLVMNQVRMLEGYSGTSMDVQLDGTKDTRTSVHSSKIRNIKVSRV